MNTHFERSELVFRNSRSFSKRPPSPGAFAVQVADGSVRAVVSAGSAGSPSVVRAVPFAGATPRAFVHGRDHGERRGAHQHGVHPRAVVGPHPGDGSSPPGVGPDRRGEF